MRNLIILVALLFSASAMSQQAKYLKGAIVTITLKNGKTYDYPSEKMAVVPRVKKKIITIPKPPKPENIRIIYFNKPKKNRIYGLAGRGLTGKSKARTDGKKYAIEQEEGTVMGIGYQRKLNDGFSLGVQVQNNKTTSLSLGLDF